MKDKRTKKQLRAEIEILRAANHDAEQRVQILREQLGNLQRQIASIQRGNHAR